MQVEFKQRQFVARLPFMGDEPVNSFDAAYNLLQGLIVRLKKNGFFNQYEEELLKYVENNYTIEVEEVNGFFMPHHAVIREQAETTKVRIVFNGSFGQWSLNKSLYKGINENLKVFPMLMKFRRGKYTAIADLEKAFLQIRMAPEDQKFLRFMWVNNGSLRCFQFVSLPFGFVASPAILNECVEVIIENMSSSSEYIFKDSVYMDDAILANSDEDILKCAMTKGIEKLKEYSFRMHKIRSNSEKIQQKLLIAKEEEVKVLGIIWRPEEDLFNLNIKEIELPKIVTKRILLRMLGSIFDPLGWVDPIKLILKPFLQIQGKSMNEELEEPCYETLKEF